MKSLKYVVYQDGNHYVSQCLNVDVSSFGKTIEEAVKNLEDAVELYLRDDLPREPSAYREIGAALIGEMTIRAETPLLQAYSESAAEARLS